VCGEVDFEERGVQGRDLWGLLWSEDPMKMKKKETKRKVKRFDAPAGKTESRTLEENPTSKSLEREGWSRVEKFEGGGDGDAG